MSVKRVSIIFLILIVATLLFLFKSDFKGGAVSFWPVQNGVEQDQAKLEGGLIYKNTKYRFSFSYPDNLKVMEYDEGQGAGTIIFEDPANALGFQIFVLPYSAQEISTDRFKKDVPSGIKLEEKPVTLDGVPGVAFFSRDGFLGDTYEVWFIYNGHLYEVTTLKENTDWLNMILNNWSFER